MRRKLSTPYVIRLLLISFPPPSSSSPLATFASSFSQRGRSSSLQPLSAFDSRHFAQKLHVLLLLQWETIQITHFEVPREIRTNASFLLLLIYTMNMPPHSTSYFWLPARMLRYIFPNVLFRAVWVFACVMGISEGVYAAYLARKHQMPWHIAVRGAFCTLIPLRLSLTLWSCSWLGSASPRSLACPC